MRIPNLSLRSVAAAVVCCSAITLTVPAAHAQDDSTTRPLEGTTETLPAENTSHVSDGQLGGVIQGVESLRIIATMSAPITSGTTTETTTVAIPSNLKGEADLRASNYRGKMSGVIKLKTEGLPAGIYTVNATAKSNAAGAPVQVGQFEIVAATTVTTTATKKTVKVKPVIVTLGTVASPLPLGFNPFDIGTLAIVDANGATLLVADFSDLSTITTANFHASVQAAPGTSTPDARGSLVISAKIRKGAPSGLFLLVARKLPANTQVSLSLNGGPDALTTPTTKQGHLKIMKSPAASHSAAAKKTASNLLPNNLDLFNIHTISVHDATTGELLYVDL